MSIRSRSCGGGGDPLSGRMALALVLTGVLVHGACSVLPKPAEPPRQHDFGPPGGAVVLPEGFPEGGLFVGVEAPEWLRNREIHYRFMHDEPTRVRAYARNVWLDAPASLIEQRVRQALGQLEGLEEPALEADQASRFRWRLVLESYEQRFAGKDQAQVVVRVRVVTTLPVAGGDGENGRVFTVRRSCEPTVRGAVRGLGEAADEAVAQALQWVGQTVVAARAAESERERALVAE